MNTESQTGDPILKMSDIKKSFPGVQALRGVDFDLAPGEVHAIVGENGAGKSTLMKIIMGVYSSDSGSIHVRGKQVDIPTAEAAHELGIAMIFQELSLVPQLDIAQNIYLGHEPVLPMYFVKNRKIYTDAQDLLERYNIAGHFSLRQHVSSLNRGYQQVVEVLKALSRNAGILIMDEPTASLTKEEEELLYHIIQRLKDRGVSIIYISHRLEEIFRNCDRVTVLRDGKKVVTSAIKDVTMERLVELMTGKRLRGDRPTGANASEVATKSLLRVKDLWWHRRVSGATFEVNYGEVVGVTGLMGSGKSEIARIIFGIVQPDKGEIWFDDRKVNIRSPGDSIGLGMALVPEDRRLEGLVLMHSVENNIGLSMVKDLSYAGWFKRRRARNLVERQVAELGIKTPTIRQQTAFLSGGNQQKVVLGKWLARDPKLLILDEPTVGIDVGTKAEVRDGIRALTKNNDRGVLLFSSDLDEILQVSDRIVVLYRGKVITEFPDVHSLREEVLHNAIQGLIRQEGNTGEST